LSLPPSKNIEEIMQNIYKNIVIFIILLIIACSEGNTQKEIAFKKDAEIKIFTNDKEILFDVELASEPLKRMQGLMFRYKMEPNQGMFFTFEVIEPQSFWMKNTYLSLDMIFIDENFKIVQIHENAFPLREDHILSDFPAKYVLEILGGVSKKSGVEVGNIVQLINE